MREMAKYIKDPHPAIEVFPSEHQADLWHLLLRGPDETPYSGGIFRLWLLFPENYPTEAPVCRFQTPIYHCNINAHGKVCHSVFDRNWTPDISVRQVLDCTFGLLLVPEPDDPLDSVLAEQYRLDHAAYMATAADRTRSHASSDYDGIRAALLANENSEPGGYPPKQRHEGHPQHLVCPITLNLFEEPVSTKYGHTYEREALLQHLENHSRDPLTQQPLASTDVFPNFSIRQAVEEYKGTTAFLENQ